MLPAFVSTYFQRAGDAGGSGWACAGRGLALGGIVSAGFLTSFALLGLLFGLVGSAVARYVPWVAVAVGALLVAVGIWSLLRPALAPSLGGRAARWLRVRPGPGLRPFFVYGMLYAVCAAACVLPIFMAVMVQSFLTAGPLEGALNFLAYGWGMSVVMLAFSVALALSKTGLRAWLPRAAGWVQRLSGAFLVLAGGYVLYYLLIYGEYWRDLLGV